MAYPPPPNDAGGYRVRPPDDGGGYRVRPDAAQFWAGGAATAIVAALIALVGILICRWTLGIPILAPAGAGAWGNAHTGDYVLGAALVAIVAAAVLYLLEFGAPAPRLFFGWIMGLATLAGVVYPFSTSAPLQQKGATAIVNLVLGIAIGSLLSAVSARAVRIARTGPPSYDRPPGPPSSGRPAGPPSGPPRSSRTYGPTEPIDRPGSSRAPREWP
jgi:Family of unknown function (DUF6069)